MPAFTSSNTLRFRLENADETQVSLGRLHRNLTNYFAFLEGARVLAIRDTITHFVKERDPEGDPWPQWSDDYRPYAEEHNIGGILYQEGDLYKAATSPEAYHINEASGSLFIDTSNFPIYWRVHQYGQIKKPKKISRSEYKGTLTGSPGEGRSKFYSGEKPGGIRQRAYLGLSKTAEAQILMLAEKWLDHSIDNAVRTPIRRPVPRPALGSIKGETVRLMPGTEAGITMGGIYYHEGRSTTGKFAKLF